MKKKRTAAKRKNTKVRRTDTQNKAAMIGISGVVSLLVIALLYQSVSLPDTTLTDSGECPLFLR